MGDILQIKYYPHAKKQANLNEMKKGMKFDKTDRRLYGEGQNLPVATVQTSGKFPEYLSYFKRYDSQTWPLY